MKRFLLTLAIIFMFKDFTTLSGAVDFMNTLPADAQPYVIALNSQRSGYINGYYSVIYRGKS